jgi:hypothetical protein
MHVQWTVPPQPLSTVPHTLGCTPQTNGSHGHGSPQDSVFPQPSSISPQLTPSASQEVGMQGATPQYALPSVPVAIVPLQQLVSCPSGCPSGVQHWWPALQAPLQQ